MKRKAGNDLTTQTLLDFDLGESSSDSDFRIEDHDDDSDDFSAGSKDGDVKGDADNDEDDDDEDDDEDEEDEESDDDEEDEADSGTTGTGSKGSDATKVDVPCVANPVQLEPITKITKAFDKATLKLLSTAICCACLGDRSDDQNEIVECDGCGVTVHEGCYGVSESTSVSSTISSCSTEPWFCEACRAGVFDPDCELCPNKGGIFKETDVGKWVHLVCALYVPGVAFGEVDQLSSVTLFEMPYNKWGAKTCSLCDDAKFARTGVCIGCDAGMCKTYFHVTCAQYAGLLSEAHSEEADQADPFYAHCKIHSDKTLIKHRKRNYNAIKLKAQNRKLEQEASKLEKPSPEQVRIERKLAKHRKKYVAHKETKNPPWVPTQKMPRLLTTSATACKKLLLKAELMGIDSAAMEFQEAQMTALADVRKKWHIPPAFSVEFIGYYLDRTVRLRDIKKNLQHQVTANKRLLEEQQRLREKYDSTMKLNQDELNRNDELKDAIEKLYDDIHVLCPNKALIPIEQIGKPPSVPPIQNPSVVINTPSSTPPARTITVPTAAALKMGVGFPLQNLIAPGDTGRILSTQCKQNSEELLNECGICKRCSDQHLLAKCDTCHLFYHLGCLNPPLTRHPKKSKLYGWQCSECDKSDDSGPEHVILPKAPRKSRTRYSKDGIIVPYDMPSPEFERSPPEISFPKRQKKSSGNNSSSESFPSTPAGSAVQSNGIETKEVRLEIPKIDPDLADKLSTGDTSLEVTPKGPAKRGRKKKVLPGSPPLTSPAVKDVSKDLLKQEVIKDEIEASSDNSAAKVASSKGGKPKEEPPPSAPPVDPAKSNIKPDAKDKRKEKIEPSLEAAIVDLTKAAVKLDKKDKTKEKQSPKTSTIDKEQKLPTSPAGPKVAQVASETKSPLSATSKDTLSYATDSTVALPTASSSNESLVAIKDLSTKAPPGSESSEPVWPEAGTSSSTHKSSHKHSKRKKEKHREHHSEDGSTAREHKRKRKRKNHDIENPNDASSSSYNDPAGRTDENRPRIKIKIKSVLDGSNTHTIIYVPNDSIEPPRPTTSCESIIASTPLNSPSIQKQQVQKAPPKADPPEATVSAPTLESPAASGSRSQPALGGSASAPSIGSAATKLSPSGGSNKPPAPAPGRGRGRRLSVGRPSRASLNISGSNTSTSAAAAAGDRGEVMCDVCATPGTPNNIVQCDECHKNYHFGCLEPPLKKTPKRRGYSWHCADCDPTDTENN
ncbi:PHD finger protein 14 [Sabethes cyaneus]|uniref:PHD finger protein 14 n=1 Tax=Sabethes cyaneus TaxID=53552 RepID=UPI00237E0AAA|nr:PHD finger protein 14 [Sabethes cyaneus]XP_053689193.1 PHD finger protein 14 [Sabethes cyaneus]